MNITTSTPELSWTVIGAGHYRTLVGTTVFRISRDAELKEYVLSSGTVKEGSATFEFEGEPTFVTYPEGHTKAGRKQSWFVLNGCKAKAHSLALGTPRKVTATSKPSKAPKAPMNPYEGIPSDQLDLLLFSLNYLPRTKKATYENFDLTLGQLQAESLRRLVAAAPVSSEGKEMEEGQTPSDEVTPEAREEETGNYLLGTDKDEEEPSSTTED